MNRISLLIHYVTHYFCQPVFPISAIYLNTNKYGWYTEILKFNLVVCQQKSWRTVDFFILIPMWPDNTLVSNDIYATSEYHDRNEINTMGTLWCSPVSVPWKNLFLLQNITHKSQLSLIHQYSESTEECYGSQWATQTSPVDYCLAKYCMTSIQ